MIKQSICLYPDAIREFEKVLAIQNDYIPAIKGSFFATESLSFIFPIKYSYYSCILSTIFIATQLFKIILIIFMPSSLNFPLVCLLGMADCYLKLEYESIAENFDGRAVDHARNALIAASRYLLSISCASSIKQRVTIYSKLSGN